MEVSYYVVKLLMGLVMAAVKCGCMAAVSLEGENGEKIHPFIIVTSEIFAFYAVFMMIEFSSASDTLSGNGAFLAFGGIFWGLIIVAFGEMVWMSMKLRKRNGEPSILGSVLIPGILNYIGLTILF